MFLKVKCFKNTDAIVCCKLRNQSKLVFFANSYRCSNHACFPNYFWTDVNSKDLLFYDYLAIYFKFINILMFSLKLNHNISMEKFTEKNLFLMIFT